MNDPRTEPVDARLFHDALRELRPDPAAFRAGVARRVAEAEQRERERAAEFERSPFLRTAASLLPVGLLPAGVATKLTSKAGAATLTPRSLLAWFVWPILGFLWLLLPVWMAFTYLGGGEGRAGLLERETALTWWRTHRRGALIAVAVVALLFWLEPAGGAAALLLASAGVLFLILARLRAAGFGSRKEVGRNCGFFLSMLVVWSHWELMRRVLVTEPSIFDLVLGVLGLGAVLCLVLALASVHRSLWSFLVRADGQEVVMALIALGLLAHTAFMFSVPVSRGFTVDALLTGDDARSQLRRHLERRLLHPRYLDWTLVADATDWLREHEVEPDLAPLAQRWEQQWQAGDVHAPGFLAAGLRLRFGAEDALRAEIEGRGALRVPAAGKALTEPLPRAAPHVLLGLRDARESAAQREAWRAALLASFGSGQGESWALRRAADVVWLLEELEPGASLPLAERARELVAASWIPARLLRHAGFQAPHDDPARERIPLPADARAAVELMARFGPPAPVDARQFERDLRARSRQPHFSRGLASLEAEALLTRDQFATAVVPPARWGHATDLLLFAAGLLLASLCTAATLRAPREGTP